MSTDSYQFGWSDSDKAGTDARRGLNEDVVRDISSRKDEPEWMLNLRLKGLRLFERKPMPTWGADLSGIDFNNIKYFVRSTEKQADTWEDLPDDIKNTYDRLGIPEAEKQRLVAGVAAQYECLRGDQLVWTLNRGHVPISQVASGDKVFSLDEDTGQVRTFPVKDVWLTGVRDTFRVGLGVHSVVATSNHPFLKLVEVSEDNKRTRYLREWRALKDLSPGDLVAVLIGTPGEDLAPGLEPAYIDENVGFSKIVSITPEGSAEVYDLSVDGPHNFVAEGIVVHNSEVVYHSIRGDLEEQGVIFLDTDTALKEHEDVFKEYFATIIPPGDNKFAALNTAVWSGGSFIYVPKGVHVDIPLQAYFRINTENMGQFERTLIIVDEDAYVHYVEGCLPAGGSIDMADGTRRPVENIKAGDHVQGHDGKSATVTETMTRPYQGNLHTITTVSALNTITVTSEHPVLAVKRSDVAVARKPRNGWLPEVSTRALLAAQPDWYPARDIELGDFLVVPVNHPTPGYTPLPPALGRLVGYYLAEGSAAYTNSRPCLTFSLHEDEADLAEDIRALSQRFYGTRGSITRISSKRSITVTVFTPEGHAFMTENVGTSSSTKTLSPELFNQGLEFTSAVVEAYMTVDGNVMRHSPGTGTITRRASTPSFEWAHQLQKLLARRGIFAHLREDRQGGPGVILGRSITRQDLYRVLWTESPDGSRGKSQVRFTGEAFLVPVRGVSSEQYAGSVYNFETSPGHTYTSNNVAVHNCTAPIYSSDSLHSAVVEIVVRKGGRCRYTTIQNWSNNVYNLVTKRAVAHAGATMEWVDGNLGCVARGSKVYTDEGPRPVELVRPGDKVASFNTTTQELVFSPVVNVLCNGVREVVRVEDGTSSLTLTPDHQFLTPSSASVGLEDTSNLVVEEYSWAPARDVVSSVLAPNSMPAYGVTHFLTRSAAVTTEGRWADEGGSVEFGERGNEIPESDSLEVTADLAWLLGLYSAAGGAGKTTVVTAPGHLEGVGFKLPAWFEGQEKFARAMSLLGPRAQVDGVDDGSLVVWLDSEAVELLVLNGLSSLPAFRRLPGWLATTPAQVREAFIAGCVDSSGCVTEGSLGITFSNIDLLNDVAQLLRTLGVRSRIAPLSDQSLSGPDDASRRLSLIFPPAPGIVSRVSSGHLRRALPGDGRSVEESGGTGPVVGLPQLEARSIKVSPVEGLTEVWDLEVEGTVNFICEGFVVHNSKVTMKYPAVWLVGEHARGETLSIAMAGPGQHQDAGAKMVHVAPHTSSNIISRSVAKGGGRTSYRGLVQVDEGAQSSRSTVRCDALLLDDDSRSDTYPYVDVREDDVSMGHEATVSKVSEDQLFYLMSRGLSESEAMATIVRGFIEPIAKELPMEYALELNRLIQMQMEGAIG